MNMTKKK